LIIRHKSKSSGICYQVNDYVLLDFLKKSQKSLDFGIVPFHSRLNFFKSI